MTISVSYINYQIKVWFKEYSSKRLYIYDLLLEMLFDIEYRLSYRLRILIRLSISVFKISDISIFIAILKKQRHLYFIHKYIIHKQKILFYCSV